MPTENWVEAPFEVITDERWCVKPHLRQLTPELLTRLYPFQYFYTVTLDTNPVLEKRGVYINGHKWDGNSCPAPPLMPKRKRLPSEFLASNLRTRVRKSALLGTRVWDSRRVSFDGSWSQFRGYLSGNEFTTGCTDENDVMLSFSRLDSPWISA